MRSLLIFVVMSSFATSALAQHNQVSLFYSQGQVHENRGYGGAFNHMWTPRFSTGTAVAMEDSVIDVCVGGIFTPQRCREVAVRTYPIDLTGRFHFLNETRWKPYVGLGVRYVSAPDLSQEELVVVGHPYSDHVDAEVVGGLDFLFTPSYGIGVEMKSLVRNREDYNPLLKVGVGIHWRF